MNTSTFSLQSSLEANYLNVTLKEPANVDEIAMKVMKADCPDFLMPFRVNNRNDQIILRYRLVNAVALRYYNAALTKDEFVRFYQSLLTPFLQSREWFLDYHYICIDPQYVYVTRPYGNVLFVYVPEASYANTDEEIMNFFKNILTLVSVSDDQRVMVRLFQYFNNGNPTLAGIAQILSDEGAPGGAGGAGANYANAGNAGGWQGVQANPANSGWQGAQANTANNGGWQGAQANTANNGGWQGAQANTGNSGWQGTQANTGNSGWQGAQANTGNGSGWQGTQANTANAGGWQDAQAKQPGIESQASKPGQQEEQSDADILAALAGTDKKAKKAPKPKKEKPPKAEKKKSSFFSSGKRRDAQQADVSQNMGPQGGGNVSNNFWQQDVPGAQAAGGFSQMPQMPGADSETEIDDVDPRKPQEGYLELVSSFQQGAPQRISLKLENGRALIGRSSSDPQRPDIMFPATFRRIGRKHAMLEKQADGCYIVDLGSQNHTLINGNRLMPNCPYRLENGMEVTFTESQPVKYRVCL